MRSPCLHMFVGAVMTPYSQQACATLHWRMRKTAGPPACRGPDSFLSSYGPITLHTADARAAAAMPLPMEPLVCCTRTVKDPKQCGFQMLQDGSSSAPWESQLFLQSYYSDVVLLVNGWWTNTSRMNAWKQDTREKKERFLDVTAINMVFLMKTESN